MKSHIVFLTLFSLIAFQIYGMQPKEEACNNLELVRTQEEIDRWGAKPQEERNQALFDAASTGKLKLVQALLDASAELDARDNTNRTPLHWAAIHGHLKVVQTLLVAGANKNAIDNSGDVPLHWAAMHGHSAVVQALIAAGANVNARNPLGDTPLHNAAIDGHLEVVKILIAAGADKDTRDSEDHTPLDWATGNGPLIIRPNFNFLDPWALSPACTEVANFLRAYKTR